MKIGRASEYFGCRQTVVKEDEIPGDAVSMDDLDAPDTWADEYIDDGAYTPQILSNDEE